VGLSTKEDFRAEEYEVALADASFGKGTVVRP
jgi:hypothetical protein